MRTISFLKWACIVSMFAWVNVAQAQEKATTAGNWDSSKTSGEYTLNGNFEVTQVIVLTGDLTINAGSAPHSITRKFTDTNTNGFGGIFRTGNHKLTINGTASAKIYIDGGAVYNTPHDARTGFKSGYKGHGIFVDTGGSIHLKYVHIRNCCVNKSLGFPACDGGGIFFKCETTGYYNSTLTDCTISGCYAVSGSAVKFSHTDHTNATFTRVWFYNNFTQSLDGSLDGSGGTIRSNGSCSSILVMDNCTMEQNRSLNGGGILWNAGGASGTKLTIKGHTRIHHNVADIRGGGIQLNTKLDLQSAVIYNNTAQYGGGIFIEPYTAFNEYMEGYGVNLTITAQDTIKNNTASNIGGGIYLNIVQCEEVGFNQSGTPIANPNHTFNMQGGVITGNQARQGAGIAILDNAAKKNKHNGVYSNEVKRWVYISGGQIYNNYSPQNGASVRGGGLYIVKHVNTGLNYAEYGGAGTITLNASGGKIYSNHANNGLGGGIYMGNQFSSSVDSHVIVNVSGSVEVYDNTSDGDGGGIYISGGDFTMTGGVVGKLGHPNICTGGNGGGFAVTGGNITINGGNINYNQSKKNGNSGGHGGAFFLSNGVVTVNGGNITHNTADSYGGGFCADIANTSITTTIKGGATIAYNKAYIGGGAYISRGNLVIQDAATNITADTAVTSGGGIYMGGGTVSVTNAKLQGNVARDGFGGGMYLGANSSNSMTVSGSEAAIKGNRAFNQGGGVYVGGGTFTMTGGAIGGALADGNFTTSADSYGGGLYMNGGTATISNCSISGNYTCSRDPDDLSGCGGAVYMNGGSCLLKGGSAIGGVPELNDPDDPDDDLYYTNVSKYGGGIYSANGTITVKGGAIGYNSAEKGGGIYSNGSKAKVYVQKDSSKAYVLSYIEHNTAEYGGGIYGEKGRVEFSDGYIQYNTASQQGGGIYVDANDTLYLKGSANMLLNGVPTGHKGGGVYLVGSIIVGEVTSPLGTIMARSNYAYTTTQPDTLLTSGGEVADSLRNNVYLPNPVVHEYGESTHAGVIEVVENGISNLSHVGFSVPHGNVPVIYCTRSSSSWGYLHQFSTGQPLQYNLFDDSGRYRSVQYSNDPTFDPDHVCLYGFWSDEVTGEGDDYCEVDMDDFVGKDTIYIYLPCQLAFFISWVNGREDPPHIDPHSTVCAKLMDDIDMSEFGWVPIGTETRPYSGVFDGNGHTVTGIRSLLNDYHTNYGFFGKLADNAVVKNLFLNEASFHIEKKSGYGGTMYIGGVAGLTSGNATIENCESASTIFVEPDNTNTVMGGLVGKMESGTIHSSIAIPDMTGFQMGGLVGQNGDSILNSFANAKFTKAVSDHTQYMGGLVGVNTGHVENCYSLMRGTAPATTYFGYLAGNNDGGTLKYSYAHQNIYVSTEGTTGTQTGIGTYGVTQLPYLYKHRDTQVDANNDYVPTGTDADKQLMIVLNRWVDTINSKQSAINYTKWGRPWQESDAQKPLNDDYPILKIPMAEAVAAEAGDPYLYYGTVDNLLTKYDAAGDAIWMYRNSESVTGDNSASAAKLYIAEDVALLNANPLKAYVGITLDNSAGADGAYPTYFPGVTDVTDWHMIATPLSDAPIGINYTTGDAYDFDYGHPSGMPYYLFYPKDDDKHGYFPSHRFGKSYPGSAATIEEGNYYTEWDFYSYYEPEYHWINFKRNSASHHHMEADGHDAIEYHNGDPLLADDLGNESRLVPGKGYFAATREETFLQCQGHLNNGAVTYNLTQTSGVPRHGYNLIGNPYQAYLNFDAFADANSGDNKIWAAASNASYTILDEDDLDTINNVETIMGQKPVFYRTYSYGCSDNPGVNADGFIHPHQGFFVRLEGDKASAQAQFAPDQRNATAKSKFRGDVHVDFPLVNLFAIEGNGAADVVTVELGRPDEGGAPLMQSLRVGNGKIWCHYDDKDYAIAYTQPGITEVGIRFETVEDTEYTMRWSTRNGEFSYLHLIDNKTGADVDCLTTDEYKFSASTSDYKSRFRLVFGYTGIEEDSEAETNENFAFMMNDALVVTGEGVLQVFDMTGRMVASQELHGVQTTMALPNVANGVYVMRLTEGKQSRIQKMVISK